MIFYLSFSYINACSEIMLGITLFSRLINKDDTDSNLYILFYNLYNYKFDVNT